MKINYITESQIDALARKCAKEMLKEEARPIMWFSEIIEKHLKPSPTLKWLAYEAVKCKTFDEFKHDFTEELKHGVYWHLSETPNEQWKYDSKQPAVDWGDPFSKPKTLAQGTLYITGWLDYWVDTFKDPITDKSTRKAAVFCNMRNVPRSDYVQQGGENNEFVVKNASLIQFKPMDIKSAKAFDKRYHNAMECFQSDKDLSAFYDFVMSNPTYYK